MKMYIPPLHELRKTPSFSPDDDVEHIHHVPLRNNNFQAITRPQVNFLNRPFEVFLRFFFWYRKLSLNFRWRLLSNFNFFSPHPDSNVPQIDLLTGNSLLQSTTLVLLLFEFFPFVIITFRGATGGPFFLPAGLLNLLTRPAQRRKKQTISHWAQDNDRSGQGLKPREWNGEIKQSNLAINYQTPFRANEMQTTRTVKVAGYQWGELSEHENPFTSSSFTGN